VILFSLAEKEEEFEKIYALFIAKVGGRLCHFAGKEK
jgi:hypothetical protein